MSVTLALAALQAAPTVLPPPSAPWNYRFHCELLSPIKKTVHLHGSISSTSKSHGFFDVLTTFQASDNSYPSVARYSRTMLSYLPVVVPVEQDGASYRYEFRYPESAELVTGKYGYVAVYRRSSKPADGAPGYVATGVCSLAKGSEL